MVEHGTVALAVRHGQREAVGRAARWVEEGVVAEASDTRQLEAARDHRVLDHLRVDEAGDVAAELGQPLGRGALGIILQRVGDHRRVEGRVHGQAGRLPHQHAAALAAVVLAVLVPQQALPGVGRGCADQQRVRRQGRQRRAQGPHRLFGGIGGGLGAPERHLIAQRGNHRATADGAIARRVHLDRDPEGAQLDPLDTLGRHQLRQHRVAGDQAADVAQQHAGLIAIGGQDHDHAHLAGDKRGRQLTKAAR